MTCVCVCVCQMSLVDLGKRLLEAARKGQDDEVRNLMANGAPFTTDWVRRYHTHVMLQNQQQVVLMFSVCFRIIIQTDFISGTEITRMIFVC